MMGMPRSPRSGLPDEPPQAERRDYVYCAGVPFGLFDRFAAVARSTKGWTYHELQTPHDAMIVDPDGVVQILTRA